MGGVGTLVGNAAHELSKEKWVGGTKKTPRSRTRAIGQNCSATFLQSCNPGTPRGVISHIHLAKSLQKVLVTGRQSLEGDKPSVELHSSRPVRFVAASLASRRPSSGARGEIGSLWLAATHRGV